MTEILYETIPDKVNAWKSPVAAMVGERIVNVGDWVVMDDTDRVLEVLSEWDFSHKYRRSDNVPTIGISPKSSSGVILYDDVPNEILASILHELKVINSGIQQLRDFIEQSNEVMSGVYLEHLTTHSGQEQEPW